MQDIKEEKEKVTSMYDFYKSQQDTEKLDLFFVREAGREDLIKTKPELVKEIHEMIQSNYPARSHLKESLTKNNVLNPNFCKDGYMYVLRGDYANCDTGFYTIQYALTGKNVEQLSNDLTPNQADFLCTRHEASLKRTDLPKETLQVFLKRQTKNGGAPFISATTNFNSAISFAHAKKGNIYVLKIKTSEILSATQKVLTGFEECEYLIPDYVDMSETVAKFNYRDYNGIKQYLTNDIGLPIKDADLLPEVYRKDGAFTYYELDKLGVVLPSVASIKQYLNQKQTNHEIKAQTENERD